MDRARIGSKSGARARSESSARRSGGICCGAMCGRYSVAIQAIEVANELRAALHLPAEMPQRFNVAPTNDAPIAIELADVHTDRRRIGLARFGLVPAESGGPKAVGARYLNLRAEGVASQRMFAESAAARRCLVIADGFYEWEKTGAKTKQAWRVHASDGALITMAGIWDVWRPVDGEKVPSFAILTIPSIAPLSSLHDRMPVIVPHELRDRWLSPEEHDAKALLREIRHAAPVALEAYRVSPRVGNVANDDPSLLDPIDDERRR